MEDVELFKAKRTERGYLMAWDIWLQDVKNDCVDPNEACQIWLRAERKVSGGCCTCKKQRL